MIEATTIIEEGQSYFRFRKADAPGLSALVEKAKARGGWISIRLSLPSRAKTSPENRLFHALCGHLAMYRETSPELMKRYIKVRACAHGYPYTMFEEGGHRAIEPKSVAETSTVELAILIDQCYELAHEWNCPLNQEVNIEP